MKNHFNNNEMNSVKFANEIKAKSGTFKNIEIIIL